MGTCKSTLAQPLGDDQHGDECACKMVATAAAAAISASMTFCECRQPEPVVEPITEHVVVEKADPAVDISAIVAQAVAAALRSRPASARARPPTPHPPAIEPAALLELVVPAAPLEP